LAEDDATAIVNEEMSLEWLDEEKLSADLTEMAEDALYRLSEEPMTRATMASSLDMGTVPPGDVIAATGIFGPGVRSQRSRQRPALTKVRWPKEEHFVKYYHPPDEMLPQPLSPKAKEVQPLPSPRKTISRLEDSTSKGVQSFIFWQFALNKEQEAATTQRKNSVKSVGMFEASAVYRHSCAQQEVPPAEMMDPRPIFGECVEVKSSSIVGTRQCYAVADAVRACMPCRISFLDTVMTDMGAARIVEAALMSGRLEHLCITGTCLSYRFCTALYNCLRVRAGNSLTEIVLRSCGLGTHLDVEPVDLPPMVANLYLKTLSALPEGIIDPAASDADLLEEQPLEPEDAAALEGLAETAAAEVKAEDVVVEKKDVGGRGKKKAAPNPGAGRGGGS
jgi:hypothetical protein